MKAKHLYSLRMVGVLIVGMVFFEVVADALQVHCGGSTHLQSIAKYSDVQASYQGTTSVVQLRVSPLRQGGFSR